jgi:hypothetical protein
MSAKIPLSIMLATTLVGCVLMWRLGHPTEARASGRSVAVVAPPGR